MVPRVLARVAAATLPERTEVIPTTSDAIPPIGRPARMHWLTLRFSDPIEREFLDQYVQNSLPAMRAAIVIGIGIYAIFGLLDPLIVPDVKPQVWFIRYAIACPVLVLCLLSTFVPRIHRFMQSLLALMLVFAGSGIIAMVAIATPPGTYLYYAGLILCVMFGYSFLRLRFVHAVASGVLLFIGYEVTAMWIAPATTPILINNTFFLVAANVIGMSASYSMESYIRRDFLQNRVIERHARELRDKNQQLVAANDELARSKQEIVQSAQRAELIFSALSEALPGTVLDEKYRVDEKIGSGGFGTVYRATHLMLHSAVAVKVFRPGAGAEPTQNLERLRLEGISASRLRHKHVVSVLDFGICAGSIAYMVMELLEGWSLKDELDAARKLSVGRALAVVAPVCDALSHAHASGIIHRDVKPSNLFLHQTADGEIVKMVDFGIAKVSSATVKADLGTLTETGSLIGTLVYMAPERLTGKTYDGQSDVYSVGIMLFEMLCGRLPFAPRDDYWAMAFMHVTEPPPAPRTIEPRIPHQVDTLIVRMLDKDPAKRPTPRDIRDTLIECLSDFADAERGPSVDVRASLARRARPVPSVPAADRADRGHNPDAATRPFVWPRRSDTPGDLPSS
jgi:serine/threonine protein kinase